MRRTTYMGLTAVIAVAVLVGSAAPAVAASGTASVAVQLTTPSGAPIRLAGVEIAAIGLDAVVADATTDASGALVFSGIPTPDTVTVTTRAIPPRGTATYAPGLRSGIVLAAGTTTATTIPLVVGATVSGAIVGPTGASTGTTMYAFNGDTSQVFRTTSDATGHYDFVGLSTGPYRIEAYSTLTASPAVWKTRVYQQRGTLPASHVTLSRHYVHSDYDLVVDAHEVARGPAPELSGATVRVTNTTTGATYETRFSTLLDTEQTAQFEVPTGQYLVRLTTVATPATPAQVLWLARPSSGYAYVPDAAAAVPVRAVFGGVNGWGGPLPE